MKDVKMWLVMLCALLLGFVSCVQVKAVSSVQEGEHSFAKGRRSNPPAHLQVQERVLEMHTFMAMQYLEDMSLDEKVGQIIFLHYRGESPEVLGKYQFGGVILFGDYFKGKTPETVTSGIDTLQTACKLPMLIGVDEEGGSVVRVSRCSALAPHKFLSPQKLYAAGGMERIVEDTREKSRLLLEYGINVNLAPVADVSTSSADYIYARTFGLPAEQTAEYVEAVVGEMSRQQIGSVLKHFPGYGSNRDTHKGFAVDDRSYDTFTESDFLPFQAGIDAGADSVLVSHNIVTCMDATLPASLSPAIHKILREDMQFDGVIMTDDLVMDAISEADFGESPAVLALLAGNDMMITTDYKRDVEALLQAVNEGRISEEQLDQAVIRVLSWKWKLGILEDADVLISD